MFRSCKFILKFTLIYQEEGEHKCLCFISCNGCILHLMVQVPGTSRELTAIARGTSAACTATMSSAPRPTTKAKAKVPEAGCQRSIYDPPVYPAVEPISFAEYPKKERNALKRRLAVEDPENVRAMQFEKGELVFTLQEEGVERHGYVLPLSVAMVEKVSVCGLKADVTYMWGASWDGVFRKAQFKDGNETKKSKNKYWTEKGMGKEGVVLMRGKRTQMNTLNSKTKQYLCEVLGDENFYQHARRKSINMPDAKRIVTRQRR